MSKVKDFLRRELTLCISLVAAVNNEQEKLSPSTQKLIGLVKEGGRLIRQLPG